MARVVRPIQFDEGRKEKRREKARVARKRRRDRQFEFGGDLYLHNFMYRMIREPWDITLKGDEGNDNWPRKRK
jgi:hypothetical protein